MNLVSTCSGPSLIDRNHLKNRSVRKIKVSVASDREQAGTNAEIEMFERRRVDRRQMASHIRVKQTIVGPAQINRAPVTVAHPVRIKIPVFHDFQRFRIERKDKSMNSSPNQTIGAKRKSADHSGRLQSRQIELEFRNLFFFSNIPNKNL